MPFIASWMLASALQRAGLQQNPLTFSQRQHGVSISAPASVTTGQTVDVTASPVHFYDPVFQYWIELPNGQFESSGPYSPNPHFSFTATSPGSFQVKVYARESNAPSNETSAQQKIYEVNSSSAPIVVSPSTQYPVQLTANEPIVRSGQPVTLTADPTSSLTAGDSLVIMDSTTDTIINQTTASGPFNVSVSFNATHSFVAEIVNSSGQVVGKSEPLTISWETQATGTNEGHKNAAGQTVSLSFSPTGVVGQPFTVQAIPIGFSDPVVQFWILAPGGSYTPNGPYQPSITYTFTPKIAGTWQVMVYARESTAPPNETSAQAATYEAKSNTHLITILPSGS